MDACWTGQRWPSAQSRWPVLSRVMASPRATGSCGRLGRRPPPCRSSSAVLRAGAVLVPVSPSATPHEISHVVGRRPAGRGGHRGTRRRRTVRLRGRRVLHIDTLAAAAAAATATAEHVASLTVERRARRRRTDRLHLGHHGKAEGSRAHPRVTFGGRVLPGVGLGLGARGPPHPVPAPVPRARPVRRALRHARGRRLRRAVRPLRRGRRPRRRRSDASTMFFGVPTMYHRLAATGRSGDLAALRLCVSGSAPLAADLWHRLARRRREGPRALRHDRDAVDPLEPSAGRAPSRFRRRPPSRGGGRPSTTPTSTGWASCSCAARRCAAATGAADDAHRPDGWFATGDLVSVADDGYVTIRGRRTELIITGGHNVYPAEVEAVLARHPGVVEVAVVGVPSDGMGRDGGGLRGGRPRPGVAPASWRRPSWRRSSAPARSASSTRCHATRWARSSASELR